MYNSWYMYKNKVGYLLNFPRGLLISYIDGASHSGGFNSVRTLFYHTPDTIFNYPPTLCSTTHLLLSSLSTYTVFYHTPDTIFNYPPTLGSTSTTHLTLSSTIHPALCSKAHLILSSTIHPTLCSTTPDTRCYYPPNAVF